MCILLKLQYAKFDVSSLFCSKVIKEKPLGFWLDPPLVKEGLIVVNRSFCHFSGINFIHNHPPAHPRGFAGKICLHPGAFASQLLPGGGRGFVGAAPEGRGICL